MKENAGMCYHDSENLSLKLMSDGATNLKMTGHTIDRIYKNGVLVDEIIGHNLVVNSFLNLVMCLLKQHNGYTGIQYWAVGSGATSWDSNMPSPELTATKLTAELGRVPISADEIKFLDTDYNEVSTPTNIIQISHTFGASDCNGVWREFGVFGGNATSIADSGIMLNKRHHAIITKTEEMTIERILRFTLSLV